MKKISDTLREAREEKGLTLDEIEKKLKIKQEYLEAIEKGRFSELPSESVSTGFVKNYAKFLGVPVSQAIPFFRREYKAGQAFHIVPEFRKTQHKFRKPFILSARGLVMIGVVILVSLFIFFQYSSLFFAPKITVNTPKEGEALSNNVVEVSGKTDPYATVTVEGEEVYVNLQGNFRKSVYLFEGDTQISVVAKNRFGKTAEKIVNVRIE